MNKTIFTIVAFLFLTPFTYSQDIITDVSGDDIQAIVLKVTSTEIEYKMFENLNGPTYVMDVSDVVMIRYENGTKDLFIRKVREEEPNYHNEQNEDLFIQGQIDAERYYDNYRPASTGTLITSVVLSPLVGLVPAIACSTTTPKDVNLNYPNQQLMNNNDYYMGYTGKARKIKSKKVWRNWGIGFGVNLVAVLILSSY